MKQHGASLQFGFISRGFLAGLAIAGVAFSYGCSSSSSSNGGSGGGAKPGTTGPVVDASKLGQDCSGGTSIGDSVAFNDTTCGAGVCIVDATGNDLNTYCSADCSNAQCPTGYVCKATTIGATNDCFIDPNAAPASGNDAGTTGTTGTTSTGACVQPSGNYVVTSTLEPGYDGCSALPPQTIAYSATAGAGCTQNFDSTTCAFTMSCSGDDGSGDTESLAETLNAQTLTGSDDYTVSGTDCVYAITLAKQ